MNKTRVVHVKDQIPGAIYIGRANSSHKLPQSDWHNPYKIGPDGLRDEVLAKYRTYLETIRPDLLARVGELRGKTLACWCSPERCHGHILAELADKTGTDEPEPHVYQVDGVQGFFVCLQADQGCYQTSDFGPFAEKPVAEMVGEQLLAAWRHDEIRLIDMEDWH